MAATTMTVHLTVDTRWSTLWVKAMPPLAYVLGQDRTLRLARWGALRLIRYRFDNGRWRWMRPQDIDE